MTSLRNLWFPQEIYEILKEICGILKEIYEILKESFGSIRKSMKSLRKYVKSLRKSIKSLRKSMKSLRWQGLGWPLHKEIYEILKVSGPWLAITSKTHPKFQNSRGSPKPTCGSQAGTRIPNSLKYQQLLPKSKTTPSDPKLMPTSKTSVRIQNSSVGQHCCQQPQLNYELNISIFQLWLQSWWKMKIWRGSLLQTQSEPKANQTKPKASLKHSLIIFLSSSSGLKAVGRWKYDKALCCKPKVNPKQTKPNSKQP